MYVLLIGASLHMFQKNGCEIVVVLLLDGSATLFGFGG
jgi:hypothetical protein